MVLLIDLSGSTSGKRNLIRKTTQHFIEAARPKDRLAIITFTDTPTVVSPLTDNRAKLLEAANLIEGGGGSFVWDALKFTLDQVVGQKTLERRRAVVFMTDGVDNALSGMGFGSSISFCRFGRGCQAQRCIDCADISWTLKVTSHGAWDWNGRLYVNARRTLELLADESGGLYYKAKRSTTSTASMIRSFRISERFIAWDIRQPGRARDKTWRTVKSKSPTGRI